MSKRSKRYREVAKKVDRNKSYIAEDAVKLLKETGASTKVDQTVTLAMHLGIDPKKADQALRGSIALPHGIGKTRRVIVFADGDEAQAAKEAGADEVGMKELAEKIQGGWLEFDVCIAVQTAMKVAGRLGKVLGPKGLMPSPKNGTVIPPGKPDQVRTTVSEFKAGKVEYRNDAQGNLHVPFGKVSFDEIKLQENLESLLDHIRGLKPSTVRGQYILNASVAAAMGPGIKLELSE
jgi:large subunit ribosomal protein L1